MSFSLDSVKYKKVDIGDNIRKCFNVVNGNPILTDGIKCGLCNYVNYRLKNRYLNISPQKLNDMVADLLEYSCGINYLKLCKQDVINNELQILFEIKKAIKYGATRKLYYDTVLDDDSLFNGIEVEYPKFKTNCSVQDVQNYFSDLII